MGHQRGRPLRKDAALLLPTLLCQLCRHNYDGRYGMGEAEDLARARQKFLELVRQVDEGVQCVVPTAPTGGNFLIALSKGKARKLLTISEDDILELLEEEGEAVAETVRQAIAELGT